MEHASMDFASQGQFNKMKGKNTKSDTYTLRNF